MPPKVRVHRHELHDVGQLHISSALKEHLFCAGFCYSLRYHAPTWVPSPVPHWAVSRVEIWDFKGRFHVQHFWASSCRSPEGFSDYFIEHHPYLSLFMKLGRTSPVGVCWRLSFTVAFCFKGDPSSLSSTLSLESSGSHGDGRETDI